MNITRTCISSVFQLSFCLIAVVFTYFENNEVLGSNHELALAYNYLPYAVPALLYFINNNLAVHMQSQMDPATYQVDKLK